MRGNQYFGQMMLHNPNYVEKLKKLFPKDVFGTISRFLFRPNNDLAKVVYQFKDQYVTVALCHLCVCLCACVYVHGNS